MCNINFNVTAIRTSTNNSFKKWKTTSYFSIPSTFCLVTGFLVYFIYGIHFSRENRTCEGYGPMVEYHGDAKLPDSSLSTMEEEVKEQQPSRREEGYF